jgi:hypothetical protein
MDRFTESDGYLRFAVEPPGRAPTVMWTSEVVRATKSPRWRARKVPLRDLCWGLIDAPLSISVWDSDAIGGDDRIGVVERARCADAGGAAPRLTIRALLECARDTDASVEERTFNFVLDAHAEVRRARARSLSLSLSLSLVCAHTCARLPTPSRLFTPLSFSLSLSLSLSLSSPRSTRRSAARREPMRTPP